MLWYTHRRLLSIRRWVSLTPSLWFFAGHTHRRALLFLPAGAGDDGALYAFRTSCPASGVTEGEPEVLRQRQPGPVSHQPHGTQRQVHRLPVLELAGRPGDLMSVVSR